MSFRNQRFRVAVFSVLPIVVMALLLWSNENIDFTENILRAQPFFIMSISKVVMIAVLVAQHPGPEGHVTRWKIWTWLDPVTIVLVFMFVGSALYYAFLWGGQSQRFTPSRDSYHVVRVLLLVDGYVSFVVGSEMLSRAIIARRDRKKRMKVEYDLRSRPDSGGTR